MKVVSYNIRKAVGLDWRRDPHRIIRVLEDLDADLVAVQEADKRLGSRPAVLPEDTLYDHTGLRRVVVTNGPSSGWHGNALLLSDRWQVKDTERLMLPGIEPRGALIADLLGPDGPITFVATHLGLRRGCRQLQLAHIREELGDRIHRSLIAADTNEWSARIGFDRIVPPLQMVSPGKSFHSRTPALPLDRFFLGKRLKAKASGVMRDGEAKVASDHLPVWVKVERRG